MRSTVTVLVRFVRFIQFCKLSSHFQVRILIKQSTPSSNKYGKSTPEETKHWLHYNGCVQTASSMHAIPLTCRRSACIVVKDEFCLTAAGQSTSDLMGLGGKNAVVTAAAQGIGRGIALALARQGLIKFA